MTPTKVRVLAALVLIVSLWTLWLGLSRAQPHESLFWWVTSGFGLQVLASAALLGASFRRPRATPDPLPEDGTDHPATH